MVRFSTTVERIELPDTWEPDGNQIDRFRPYWNGCTVSLTRRLIVKSSLIANK